MDPVGEPVGIRAIDEFQYLGRQVILPRMEVSADPAIGGERRFPGAFLFKESPDGRRVESLIWLDVCSEDEVFRWGIEKAGKDRAGQVERRPDTPEANQYWYAGYLKTTAGMVAKAAAFSVTHKPENGIDAHVEIELLPDFTDRMKAKAAADNAAGVPDISKKQARVLAINLLLHAFEIEPLHEPPRGARGPVVALA